MLTKEQIREDLEDIRVYYSIKSVFDKAPAEIKAEALLEKLELNYMSCIYRFTLKIIHRRHSQMSGILQKTT